MNTKRWGFWLLLGLWLAGTAVPGASQGFLWDGSHWSKSSEDGKLGYLWGLSNLADLEVSSAAKAGTVSAVSQTLQREMQRTTAVELMREVDRFYRQHPDRQKMTVLEVLLSRQVSPGGQPGAPSPK